MDIWKIRACPQYAMAQWWHWRSLSRSECQPASSKPIRHIVCAGALGRVKPNPRVVPLNEL